MRIRPLSWFVVAAVVFAQIGARADLIAHYTFDAGEPLDEVGGNDGLAEGDAASDGPGVGPDGLAFRFGGAGHVVVPIDLNPTPFPDLTVTMWVKADADIVDASGLYKTYGHDNGGWDRTFGLDNRQGEFRWAAFNGAGITQTTGTPVTSEWTFLAAVWDTADDGTATVRFHANENNITEPLAITEGFSTVAIGNLRPDNFAEGFRGLIDEVQIHDVALTIEEVEAIRAEVPPPGAGPPMATTGAVVGFGDGAATLRGAVNPNGLATTARFEWGPTADYGNVTPDVDAGDGFGDALIEATLDGLENGATYHFRVVATNASGTATGEDATFLVPGDDPVVYYSFDAGDAADDGGNAHDGVVEGDAVAAAPGIGDAGETFQFAGAGHVVVPLDLNPTVYPDLTVTMWVKPDESVAETSGLYKTFGHDNGGWDRTFGLDNRQGPYRWAAFHGAGITQTTNTPVTAEWTFLAAVWETADDGSATIRFHANANSVTEPLNVTSGFATAAIGNLRPDNFAEGFRGLIDEVKIFGTALSPDEVEAIRAEFAEAEAGPPVAISTPASGIGPGTATLNGRVIPNGAATTAWFEYGLTTDYGMTTPEVDVGSGFADVTLDALLEGLEERQTYHFRMACRSDLGTSAGEDQSFFAPDSQVLLAHYTFENGDASDSSGAGNDGTPEGDATPVTADRQGDPDGEAFQFSGAGHIVVPINLNPSQFPDLTVAMWVKADESIAGTSGLYKVFGHDDGGWDRTYGLDNREPAGDFRWAAFTGGAGPGPTQNTGEAVTSDWTFLAAVWDTAEDGSATVRFHVNEAQIIQPLTNTTGFATAAIGNLRPDNFNEGWVGLIDDVRIFGSALSEEDIAEIRDGGTPPPPPKLRPGNVNGDGDYNISDAVTHLNFLFSGVPLLECYVVPGSMPVELTEAGLAILDYNGDGRSDLADAVASLNFLFGGGFPPALGEDCVEIESGCAEQCL